MTAERDQFPQPARRRHVRPEGVSPEEAERQELLAELRLRFLQRVRDREGRAPEPDPDVEVGFWSPAPLLGFRLWYAFPRQLMGARHTWPRPELEARCSLYGSGAPHAGGGCRCGIYAMSTPEGLPSPERVRMRPGAGIAYGVVSLSGVVVEHERGYRAARAEAVAMVMIHGSRAVGGADRWWIRRVFQKPGSAFEEAEAGVWPRVKPMAPSAGEIVRFLRNEAAKLEEAWTSASRSE